MIALDTNVLVRFLVADDLAQTDRARAYLQGCLERGELLFVSDIVLVELVWVLGFSYKLRRIEIVNVVRELLQARQLCFASTDRMARVIRAYSSGRGDFADYLIREDGRAAGCTTVATFDQDLLREDGFVAVA